MPNKNYVNGRYKEYKIVKELKKRGYKIAQRSAGSHSPIDVFAVHRENKEICFVQAKPESLPESEKTKLEQENDWLNDTFRVEFIVE